MDFDWRNPNYVRVFEQRAERLAKLRADPALLASVRYYYRTHLDDFVSDWGVTVDPRVASKGRSSIMPMVLWPKQREYIRWWFARWLNNEPGTVVKSRDVGISWLTMGASIGLCTLYEDVTVGFGSEKEDKIDRSGDPDCLFYKGRMFVRYLPLEFRGGCTLSKDTSAHMRLSFPGTGSSITGEAGDNIGRGGRKSVYNVDESAHVPNPKAIDASLSANTDVRVDMSSVNGMANSFAERAHNPDIPRFDFHFKDDPRKDAAWEAKKRNELDEVIFAAEYDCNFTASVEGLVIPALHVTAALDAHKKLGLVPNGRKSGALDVADGGADTNAFCIRNDWLIQWVEQWRGSVDLDIMHTTQRAFMLCDMNGLDAFHYDGDGVGAGVRGMQRTINEQREENKQSRIGVQAFRSSGEVHDAEAIVVGTERTAEDFFENAKAQAWWELKRRFAYTYRIMEEFKAGTLGRTTYDAVRGIDGWEVDLTSFIAIESTFPERARLCIELSQPVWAPSKRGKIMVDKCPVGTKTEVRNAIKSPNLADSVMIAFAPRYGALSINPTLLRQLSAPHAANHR